MKCRLFNLLTALSLLVCVAAVALWVRSYFVGYWFTWRPLDADPRSNPMGKVMIWTGRGEIAVGSIDYAWGVGAARKWRPDLLWAWGRNPASQQSLLRGEAHRWGGFGISGRQLATWIHEWRWQVCFPLWLPPVLFAMLPAAVGIRRLRNSRRSPGLCPRCGYDLRATPGRCPERGTAATTPP